MTQLTSIGLSIALALNSVILVCAVPGFSVGNIRFGSDKVFDKEYENVNSNIYNVISSVANHKKEKCEKTVRVSGNGVGDEFNLPCSPNGVITIATEKLLIFGNPKQDALSLYSDAPSTLIVFKGGKCTKREYKTVSKKTTAEITDLSDDECTQFRNKISDLEEQASKLLENLDKAAKEKGTQSSKTSGHYLKTAYKSLSNALKVADANHNIVSTNSHGNSKSSGTTSSSSSAWSLYSKAKNGAGKKVVPETGDDEDITHSPHVTVTELLSGKKDSTHEDQHVVSHDVADSGHKADSKTVTDSGHEADSKTVAGSGQEADSKTVAGSGQEADSKTVAGSGQEVADSKTSSGSRSSYLSRLNNKYKKLKS